MTDMTRDQRVTLETITACLKAVIDPELGINIVDLGLIYGVRVEGSRIEIDLTLTNPDGPMAGTLATEVEQVVRSTFEEIEDVEVGLVFDPPWTLERLSEEARTALGYTG